MSFISVPAGRDGSRPSSGRLSCVGAFPKAAVNPGTAGDDQPAWKRWGTAIL